MFELWVVIEGNGKGEVLLVDAGTKEDLPPQLRRRVKRVGLGPFSTEAEAAQFRRKYKMAQGLTAGAERAPSTP